MVTKAAYTICNTQPEEEKRENARPDPERDYPIPAARKEREDCMKDYSEQKKEIATIKERSIKLRLSDADVTRISEKAASVGLTVSELLESFIGDLTDGTYSNGSDERMLANEWFDRCGFSLGTERTFLAFLADFGSLQDAVNTLEYIEERKGELREAEDQEEREAIQRDIDGQKGLIEAYYKSYEDAEEQPQPKEDALESLRAYKDKLKEFGEGGELC